MGPRISLKAGNHKRFLCGTFALAGYAAAAANRARDYLERQALQAGHGQKATSAAIAEGAGTHWSKTGIGAAPPLARNCARSVPFDARSWLMREGDRIAVPRYRASGGAKGHGVGNTGPGEVIRVFWSPRNSLLPVRSCAYGNSGGFEVKLNRADQ
jgi:hypothetical protein